MKDGLKEGWLMIAKELKLYERCHPEEIKGMRLMFMTGAMYAATHRSNLEQIFIEGMREFDLFESNR
jgi:hypothetical protein